MILAIYFIGFLTVWIIDKRMTNDTGWNGKIQRLAVALFSWITLVMFLFVRSAEYIGGVLDRSKFKPVKWL